MTQMHLGTWFWGGAHRPTDGLGKGQQRAASEMTTDSWGLCIQRHRVGYRAFLSNRLPSLWFLRWDMMVG